MAPVARRLGATVVDVLVQLLVLFVAQSALFLAGVRVGPVLVAVLAQGAWLLVQLRLARGQTFGMQAVGIHAERRRGGGLPGRRAALVRWAVVACFALPVTLVADAAGTGDEGSGLLPVSSMAATVGVVGLVAVFAGVFVRPWRQGLHDRAAGVVVVLDA